MQTLPSRSAWLQMVALATLAHREERAAYHERAATRAIDDENESTYRWHTWRKFGQIERFERVDKCGTEAWQVACSSCGGTSHTVANRCGAHRVCLPCRAERASRLRAKFRTSREQAAKRFDGVHVGFNEFRETFITLTVAHHPDGTRNDIAVLYDAWGRFRLKLLYWLRSRQKVPKRYLWNRRRNPDTGRLQSNPMVTPYLRVTEIGTTSVEGHAHFHFWAVLPYVPHVVFRRLWGEALRDVPYVPIRRVVDLEAEARERWESDPSRLKRELANIDAVARPRRDSRERRAWVPWPVVHVRPADNVETELVKYLVKDLVPEDEGAQYVDPMRFADWYAALEGRRLVTASCGFWLEEPEAHCRVCGSVGCLRLVIPTQEPQTGAGSERGPPPLATAP